MVVEVVFCVVIVVTIGGVVVYVGFVITGTSVDIVVVVGEIAVFVEVGNIDVVVNVAVVVTIIEVVEEGKDEVEMLAKIDD